jgi:hypothetical protein
MTATPMPKHRKDAHLHLLGMYAKKKSKHNENVCPHQEISIFEKSKCQKQEPHIPICPNTTAPNISDPKDRPILGERVNQKPDDVSFITWETEPHNFNSCEKKNMDDNANEEMECVFDETEEEDDNDREVEDETTEMTEWKGQVYSSDYLW